MRWRRWRRDLVPALSLEVGQDIREHPISQGRTDREKPDGATIHRLSHLAAGWSGQAANREERGDDDRKAGSCTPEWVSFSGPWLHGDQPFVRYVTRHCEYDSVGFQVPGVKLGAGSPSCEHGHWR